MQTHIGTDLHQRFCYLTAVDTSGRQLKQGQAINDGPREVVVDASGFWLLKSSPFDSAKDDEVSRRRMTSQWSFMRGPWRS